MTQGGDWLLPLLRASEEVRRFMLSYRPSGDMDERGITTHVARMARSFGQSGSWPGLGFEYDAELPGQGGERVHGADYEVTLKGGGLLATFRLQAKRLYPALTSPGSYESLKHNSGGKRQVDRLLEQTPSTANAGYVFYNALENSVADVESGCCLGVPEDAYGLGGLGLTLAPAHAIARPERWGKMRFDDIFPVSSPVACLARCDRMRARVDRRYPLFDPAPRPWELPLFAAVEWARLAYQGEREPLARLVRTRETSSEADALLRRFAPFLDVTDGPGPEYLEELYSTGAVSAEVEERPASVIAVLDADRSPERPR